jgi:hypothetical protein
MPQAVARTGLRNKKSAIVTLEPRLSVSTLRSFKPNADCANAVSREGLANSAESGAEGVVGMVSPDYQAVQSELRLVKPRVCTRIYINVEYEK